MQIRNTVTQEIDGTQLVNKMRQELRQAIEQNRRLERELNHRHLCNWRKKHFAWVFLKEDLPPAIQQPVDDPDNPCVISPSQADATFLRVNGQCQLEPLEDSRGCITGSRGVFNASSRSFPHLDENECPIAYPIWCHDEASKWYLWCCDDGLGNETLKWLCILQKVIVESGILNDEQISMLLACSPCETDTTTYVDCDGCMIPETVTYTLSGFTDFTVTDALGGETFHAMSQLNGQTVTYGNPVTDGAGHCVYTTSDAPEYEITPQNTAAQILYGGTVGTPHAMAFIGELQYDTSSEEFEAIVAWTNTEGAPGNLTMLGWGDPTTLPKGYETWPAPCTQAALPDGGQDISIIFPGQGVVDQATISME